MNIPTEKLATKLETISELFEETDQARFLMGLRASADRLRTLQRQLDIASEELAVQEAKMNLWLSRQAHEQMELQELSDKNAKMFQAVHLHQKECAKAGGGFKRDLDLWNTINNL
jgi:hypothetical protein